MTKQGQNPHTRIDLLTKKRSQTKNIFVISCCFKYRIDFVGKPQIYVCFLFCRTVCVKNCTKRSMYISNACLLGRTCAVLLTSDWQSMKFVIDHITESGLLVNVLFLGPNLRNAIDYINEKYAGSQNKSLVSIFLASCEIK